MCAIVPAETCRGDPNWTNSTSRNRKNAVTNERKKNVAKPKRDRFQGKSFGEAEVIIETSPRANAPD